MTANGDGLSEMVCESKSLSLKFPTGELVTVCSGHQLATHLLKQRADFELVG